MLNSVCKRKQFTHLMYKRNVIGTLTLEKVEYSLPKQTLAARRRHFIIAEINMFACYLMA